MIVAANSNVPSTRYHRLDVPRLNRLQVFAFKEIAPTALCIWANLAGSQPRHWGDNIGGWPVLLGLTQAWPDHRSAQMSLNEPYQERALVARLWCETWDEADLLWQRVYQALRGCFRDGRREWMDFDAGADLADITGVILDQARHNKIATWTDAEMICRLDDLLAMAARVQREGL